jgi:probable phosphoglycerate mutase
LPGFELNQQGRAEAEALAARLANVALAAIYTSPLERARATAQAIANGRAQIPEVLESIHEFDFGEWTGKTLAELEPVAQWKQFNAFRSGTRAPGGESMLDVQARMVRAVERLHVDHEHERVALVSHGDPLRALLLYYLGTPLDLVQRIEIATASVSVLELESWGARITRLNDVGPSGGF